MAINFQTGWHPMTTRLFKQFMSSLSHWEDFQLEESTYLMMCNGWLVPTLLTQLLWGAHILLEHCIDKRSDDNNKNVDGNEDVNDDPDEDDGDDSNIVVVAAVLTNILVFNVIFISWMDNWKSCSIMNSNIVVGILQRWRCLCCRSCCHVVVSGLTSK